MLFGMYFGLVVITTMCKAPDEPCMVFYSSFVQQEPFYTSSEEDNAKWCEDSKVFAEQDMATMFPDHKIKTMECSFRVVPYLSKNMMEKMK